LLRITGTSPNRRPGSQPASQPQQAATSPNPTPAPIHYLGDHEQGDRGGARLGKQRCQVSQGGLQGRRGGTRLS
jgi:hypothetical protein